MDEIAGFVIGRRPFVATAESAEIVQMAELPRDVAPQIRDYLIVSIASSDSRSASKRIVDIALGDNRRFTWSFEPNKCCRAT